LADLGNGELDFVALGGGDQFLFEIAQAALFILAYEFADVLAGVPQSPEATCPSTYSFRASGSEMFREVMGMAS
jgi:hypothetical protein